MPNQVPKFAPKLGFLPWCVRASVQSITHACMHPCLHACMHASMHACMHAITHPSSIIQKHLRPENMRTRSIFYALQTHNIFFDQFQIISVDFPWVSIQFHSLWSLWNVARLFLFICACCLWPRHLAIRHSSGAHMNSLHVSLAS